MSPDNTTNLPRSNTARRNRAFGFNAETELMQWFRDQDISAEKLALSGSEDEGDLYLSELDVVVQLKTFAPRTQKGEDRALSPTTLKRWLKDLDNQVNNYQNHRGRDFAPEGMLVVKTKGFHWDDAFVVARLKDTL